ncbi:unnamed protein product [Plutella xylostella]|uniref:(diamondback moth) hypothetical protein n=1 Tax=Plutella xylostella TaxID=51655 RepID=A0A8S4D6K0_PLUXY|nr:unnamed protein product [Plutella xylostella]
MPLRRSPPTPKTTTQGASHNPIIQTTSQNNAATTSNLKIPRDDDISINVTQRKKSDSDAGIKLYIKEMFDTFSGDIQQRFVTLQESVTKIKNQNDELQKSVCFLSDSYDSFLKRFEILEAEKIEDRKYIKLLEEKINYMERKSFSSSVEIRNLPSDQFQTKREITDVIMKLASTVESPIILAEINDVYRQRSTSKASTPIVAHFTTVIKKEEFLSAVKLYNKSRPKEQKLNTGSIKLNGPPKPIFVSEYLPFGVRRLFFRPDCSQKRIAMLTAGPLMA